MVIGGVGAAFEASDSGMIAGLGFAAILLAVLGIVGGAVAPSHPKASAVIQLISGVGGFVAISAFWLLSGPFLLVGALLALLGRKTRAATVA